MELKKDATCKRRPSWCSFCLQWRMASQKFGETIVHQWRQELHSPSFPFCMRAPNYKKQCRCRQTGGYEMEFLKQFKWMEEMNEEKECKSSETKRGCEVKILMKRGWEMTCGMGERARDKIMCRSEMWEVRIEKLNAAWKNTSLFHVASKR